MSDRRNQIVVTNLHRALEATGLAAVMLCLALAAAAGPGRDIKPKTARALPDKEWLNTPENKPLKLEELRGKVVLVEFWTFACFNSRNTLPYVKAWHEKYNRQGLVVIGVHTPESSASASSRTCRKRCGTSGLLTRWLLTMTMLPGDDTRTAIGRPST